MLTLQKLGVKDVYTPGFNTSLVVGPDEDFSEVIKRFANHPELPGIFVVNAKQHLLGVITRADLLDWARIKIGAFLHVPAAGLEKTLRLASLMYASTAGQVMHPTSHRAAVHLNQPLAQALRLMMELDLIVLPVVDDSGQMCGIIKLSNILNRIVQESEQAPKP
jgi:Mg/Co/Ni transporter MgtE